jgi:hypothetical protein
MSSTSSLATRKKVLTLRAERLQKEIELLQNEEDQAILEENSLTADPSPPSFPTFSNSTSSFGSFSSLDESQKLSDQLIQAGVMKQLADKKIEFYEKDLEKAKASTGARKAHWLTTTNGKLDKHRNNALYESSVIADCIKRLGSLATPTTDPTAAAGLSLLPSIDHKPVYDGHSGQYSSTSHRSHPSTHHSSTSHVPAPHPAQGDTPRDCLSFTPIHFSSSSILLASPIGCQ